MGVTRIAAGRLTAVIITLIALGLTFWGQRYGAAELPHTAACLTATLPMAGLSWLLREPLPAIAALVLVGFIQFNA